MTIEFDCPHCRRLLRTPDDKAGLSAECPSCGTPVTVPAAEPFETEDAFGADVDSSPSAGNDFDDFFSGGASNVAKADVASDAPADSRRDCPACGESIAVAAQRCRFCGEQFAAKPHPQSPQSHRQKDSNLALISMILGIVSLPALCVYGAGIPFAIAAIIVGYVALGHINRGEAEGKGMAVAGICCGAGVILLIAILVVVVILFGFQANQFNNF